MFFGANLQKQEVLNSKLVRAWCSVHERPGIGGFGYGRFCLSMLTFKILMGRRC